MKVWNLPSRLRRTTMPKVPPDNFIDKEEFRDTIIKYNELNPKDDGEWLERYEKTVRTRAKGDETKIAKILEFINRKKKHYATKREYTKEWFEVENKLVGMFDKLVRKRIPCFKIPFEDFDDIYSECMYALLKYINRYDETQNTSAFAYATTICSNAIKLWLEENAQSMFCRLPMDVLDREVEGFMGHSEYYGHEDYEDYNE